MDDNGSTNQTTTAQQGLPQQVPPVGTTPAVDPNAPISAFATPLQKARPAEGSPPMQPPIVHKKNNLLVKALIGAAVIAVIFFLVMLFLPKGKAENVKLVWWGLWEDTQTMNAVIADFQRENPTITVEYSRQDPKQYRERLMTRIANGSGPDIFRFHNTWYPMMSEITSPLPSDVVTVDQFKKDYYPVMQQDLIQNGAIYGIPLGADTISLFVNTDLLKAAGVSVPKNWDEFVKAAKSLTVKDEEGKIKTSGAALGAFNNVTHAPDIISLLFVQQGVNMQKFSSFTNDQTDVLDFYTSFASGDNKTWDSTLDSSIMAFSQGKAAMYFGYSWDIFTIQKYNKELPFGVYSVPKLFNREMTIASYWAEGVSAKSSHQKEAFLFMQYLAKKETAQKLYTIASKSRGFGVPYARTDLASTLKDNARIYPFVSQLPHATSSFLASDTYDGEGGLNSSSNTYLGKAIDAIVNDGSSPGTEIEALNAGINQILSKYVVQ